MLLNVQDTSYCSGELSARSVVIVSGIRAELVSGSETVLHTHTILFNTSLLALPHSFPPVRQLWLSISLPLTSRLPPLIG